ncbi:MAG: DUF4363 family protein [Firmicutes bacterium]|nr:DUF4363 family protein [Bacillota bacterium]
MKRFWIGLGLLAALLAVSVVTMLELGQVHERIAAQAEAAAAAAQAGDLAGASATLEACESEWSSVERLCSAFADHEPLEQMRALFSQARIELAAGSPTEAAVACTRLALLSRSVGESHSLHWWNLL